MKIRIFDSFSGDTLTVLENVCDADAAFKKWQDTQLRYVTWNIVKDYDYESEDMKHDN